MIIETLLVLTLLEIAITPVQSECAPEAVCYPIDPQNPKPAPPNCFFDEEGNLTCNPIDPSGKF